MQRPGTLTTIECKDSTWLTSPLPSTDYLHKRLAYDPETGGLTWKPREPEIFTASGNVSAEARCKQWNSRYAGKPAFTAVSRSGYFVGNLDYSLYLAHRVIFKMLTGEEPECIDHINRDTRDNRPENLRAATKVLNGQNCRVRSDSPSGVAGVKRSANGKGWLAQITMNGKFISLGTHRCFWRAVQARRDAEQKYWSAA